jgi:hypothetical protein
MKIQTSNLILETDSPVKEEANKLRGYIGNQFPEHLVLHHHIQGTQYLYTYPKVQYKIIEGTPSILGIEEGAEVIKKISSNLEELKLGKNTYKINQQILYQSQTDIRPDKPIQYKFITPWIGLNSKNYQTYRDLRDWKEKKHLLNKTMVGNVLSMCKGLGIIANRRLEVHSLLNQENIRFKGIDLIAFTGEFRLNFRIPDFFGLGKGVSQGFGTIKEAKNIESVK